MTTHSFSRPAFAGVIKTLSILLIVLGFPLGLMLPGWWGFENGPVENTQAVILVIGFLHAIILFRRADPRSKRLWLAGIPLWFVLIARELSFGAVFLPPNRLSAHGPVFSVNQLSYKPFITPVVLALIVFTIAVIAIKRLDRLGLELLREKMAPWFSLGLVAVAMTLSTIAEGNLGFRLPMDGLAAQNAEEIIELGAYLALWAAQFEIFAAFAFRENS